MSFDDLTFLQGLTLILIGLLFFKEEIIPWIKEKLGFKSGKMATSEQMEELSDHYNHETTDLLTGINEGIAKVNENLIVMGETIKEVSRKQQEWEKYGVPARCLRENEK